MVWLATSIATPIVATLIARHDEAAGRLAYLPLALVAAVAILALATY